MQMRFISTKTNANEVHMHKIKGKRGCEAHEQRQLRLLSTKTRANANELHEHKIMGKLC